MPMPTAAALHHTCLVHLTIEAVRAAKAELFGQSRALIPEGGIGDDVEIGYFQFPEIGSPVEVLFLDVAQFPPPEQVI